MRFCILFVLFLAACGKPNTPVGAIVTPQPVPQPNQQFQIVLLASKTSTGVMTNGVSTAQTAERVYLPNLSDFVVLSNSTNFYHVTISIGSVSCDYIHQAGASTLTSGSGCTTTDSFSDLVAGEAITVSIPSSVAQTTNIQVLLNIVYK